MYEKQLGEKNPGMILILLDQSSSMDEAFPGRESKTKMEFATQAVNRCIYEIIEKCVAGDRIKERCYIGVIVYGNKTHMPIAGTTKEVDAQCKQTIDTTRMVDDGMGGLTQAPFKNRIWIQPLANGSTPMADAFRLAASHIEKWIQYNPDSFPPIVINITDGMPNDAGSGFNETLPAVQRVMSLSTSDGASLILNAHIGEPGKPEILLPIDANQLPDEFGRMLFQMSSPMPEPMINAAHAVGFSPKPGSRGMVMNAGAETLIKLIAFGSNTSQAAQGR